MDPGLCWGAVWAQIQLRPILTLKRFRSDCVCADRGEHGVQRGRRNKGRLLSEGHLRELCVLLFKSEIITK